MGRGRGRGALIGLWQHPLERGQGGHWERRGAGDFQRRPDSQLGRDMRGSGLRIPGFPGV